MLAGFTSRPVLSGPWSPTPCRLVARVTSLYDCIVSMQALAFAGSFHFAKYNYVKVRPTTESRLRDRERGLSKLSGVDVLYMFILRDPIGSFSDWQRRPSEGPQLHTAVMHRTFKNMATDRIAPSRPP